MKKQIPVYLPLLQPSSVPALPADHAAPAVLPTFIQPPPLPPLPLLPLLLPLRLLHKLPPQHVLLAVLLASTAVPSMPPPLPGPQNRTW